MSLRYSANALQSKTVCCDRWELFWEALHGQTGAGSITDAIGNAISSLANLFSAIADDFLSKCTLALAGMVGNRLTAVDYAEHRTLLDSHIAQKEKLILVAHSQGICS